MSIIRRPALALAAALVLATGWSSASYAAGGRAQTSGAAAATATTLPITSISSSTVPSSARASAPSGTILMIKLYVGNTSAAERFYGAVFGAKPVIKIGSIPIVTFPKGGPGLVLLKRGPHETGHVGGFIIQVPSLGQAKALALANGATVQGRFAGKPNGQAAQSIDLLDPWGNNVEILQLG